MVSPLHRERVARGKLVPLDSGTQVAFRLELPNSLVTLFESESALRDMIRILLSNAWQRFDEYETAFITHWLCDALDATENELRANWNGPFRRASVLPDDPSILVIDDPQRASRAHFAAAVEAVLGGDSTLSDTTRRYVAVIESSDDGYTAYVPDLLGCEVTGATIVETERLLESAVLNYLNGAGADGDSLPEPTTLTRLIEVRN